MRVFLKKIGFRILTTSKAEEYKKNDLDSQGLLLENRLENLYISVLEVLVLVIHLMEDEDSRP